MAADVGFGVSDFSRPHMCMCEKRRVRVALAPRRASEYNSCIVSDLGDRAQSARSGSRVFAPGADRQPSNERRHAARTWSGGPHGCEG